MKDKLTLEDKIIFLDIDGVLNTPLYMIQSKERGRALNPVAIHSLNCLIEATGADVVLSSTWRYNSTPEDMTQTLQEKGFKYTIRSFTPRTDRDCRGTEIRMWIDARCPYKLNFHEYIILDDDSDMLYWQRENFVHCPMDCGLTPNIAYRTWRKLMSKRNWIEPEHDYETTFGMYEHLDQWLLNKG